MLHKYTCMWYHNLHSQNFCARNNCLHVIIFIHIKHVVITCNFCAKRKILDYEKCMNFCILFVYTCRMKLMVVISSSSTWERSQRESHPLRTRPPLQIMPTKGKPPIPLASLHQMSEKRLNSWMPTQ